jgi:hypothetical protein
MESILWAGDPLHYFAVVGRKNADIPPKFLESKGIFT